MALSVKLEVFEGPLDLLLHLIDKNKIDIYDIPIVMITEQYLDYIKQMQEEDMNIMSEFLVMAATLLDIKCKMLLPPEVNEEGEEEDPRTELVEKLLEYKVCKYMSFELKDRSLMASRYVYKEATLPEEVAKFKPPLDYDELLKDLNLQELNRIFRETLKRNENKIDPIRSKFGNIEKDEINLEGKSNFIKAYIWEHKVLMFRELLERQNSKLEIIVTFLAVLELIKTGLIEIEQNGIDDDIRITVAENVSDTEFLQADLENV